MLERIKQGVVNAVRILRELTEKGYDGGITILREFMAPRRPVYTAKVTPRFETEPGRQAQVDVGHFTYRAPDSRLRNYLGGVPVEVLSDNTSAVDAAERCSTKSPIVFNAELASTKPLDTGVAQCVGAGTDNVDNALPGHRCR